MGAMRREGCASMRWHRQRRPRLSVLFDAPRDGGGLEPSDRAPPTQKETAASLGHPVRTMMLSWESILHGRVGAGVGMARNLSRTVLQICVRTVLQFSHAYRLGP